ncbi:MAG: glycosyltransferase family 39 protein [Bacteroidota bacterium]
MQRMLRPIAIILLVFLVKLASVFYLVHLSKCNGTGNFMGIASMSGDAHSYITPIDNFLKEGTYYYDDAKAGRMPYLGSIYMVFRMFFNKETALSALVLMQILIGSISVYCMGRLSYMLTGAKSALWIFIILSLASLHVTIFDFAVLTESLGTAFIGIFLYLHFVYLSKGRKLKDLFYSGAFLALTILFKPYLSLLFIAVGIEFLWFYRSHSLLKMLKKTAVCSLCVFAPFFILNFPWTVRNYLVFQRFVPFQQDVNAGYGYSNATLSVYGFIQSIGESYVSWDKRSAGCYFEPVEGLPCEYEIPERILGPNLTMEKIQDARAVYASYMKSPNDSLEQRTIAVFEGLTEAYESDHPISYHLLTPLVLVKHFLIHSGSYFMPISTSSSCFHMYQLAIKVLQSVLYYLALILGMAGLLLLFRKNGNSFLLILIPSYLVLFFPIFMARSETRYFHLAIPVLLIGLTYVLYLFGSSDNPIIAKLKRIFLRNS